MDRQTAEIYEGLKKAFLNNEIKKAAQLYDVKNLSVDQLNNLNEKIEIEKELFIQSSGEKAYDDFLSQLEEKTQGSPPTFHEPTKNAFENIYKDVYSNVVSREKPVAYYVGGQPGSGKSAIVEDIIQKDRKNAVIIDTDHFRTFHPQYSNVMSNNPQLAYELLDSFGISAAEKIIDTAIKEKKDIVFDGTMGGNYDFLKSSVEKMKAAGYGIEINVLALNAQTSAIGIKLREEKELQKGRSGRTVDVEYHNQVYEKIPHNINKIINSYDIDNVTVYTRNYKEYSTEKTANFNPKMESEKKLFEAVYKNERERRLTPQEYAIQQQYREKTEKLITKRTNDQYPLKEFKESLELAKQIPNSLIGDKTIVSALDSLQKNDIKLLKNDYTNLSNDEKKYINYLVVNDNSTNQQKFKTLTYLGVEIDQARNMIQKNVPEFNLKIENQNTLQKDKEQDFQIG